MMLAPATHLSNTCCNTPVNVKKKLKKNQKIEYQKNLRLTISPAILYLVTTISVAIVFFSTSPPPTAPVIADESLSLLSDMMMMMTMDRFEFVYYTIYIYIVSNELMIIIISIKFNNYVFYK